MKHFFFLVIAIISLAGKSFSQGPNQDAPYLRFPTLPPFVITSLDSTNFVKADMKKNTESIIMYFNPGCDHCRHQTDSLIAHMDKFKNVQIVMATYQPLEDIKVFADEYKLQNYPNIRIGRDGKYFLQPFYKILNLPFLALYDKKGKLLTTFEGTTPVEKLLGAFAKN